MAKKIEWLDKFANDQYSKMTKTASQKKIANQIIVDRSTYPNAKVGSLVDYDNNKYKIVDTKYRDKSGPGLLLEEVACGCDTGVACTGDIKTTNGVVPATTEVKDPNTSAPAPAAKTAAKKELDLDFDALADFDDSKFNADDSEFDLDEDKADEPVAELTGNIGESEYPDTITRPGGVKPAPSADIEGPGKKNVTDPPYHPTYDPGEKYALESLDEWQDAADRTAAAIKQEDAQDRTTVEGHYTWNQYIDAILDEDPVESITNIDEELPPINDDDDDEVPSVEDTDVNEDEDLDLNFDDENDVDTDMDEELPSLDDETTDTDVENNADDVDSAVDSMLDDDEFPSLDDETTDTEIETDTDMDEELPSLDDETTDDIPSDFSEEENAAELDFSDEDKEEDHTASNQSKTKQLSRLAFNNR